MQGGFESVQKTASEYSVVWVQYVNHIEGCVFCVQVLWGAK
jgi:hypothetical protein